MHLQKCIAKIHSLHIHINTFLLCKLQEKKPQDGHFPLSVSERQQNVWSTHLEFMTKLLSILVVVFFLQHVYSFAKHHPVGCLFKCTYYSKVLWLVSRSCYLTWPQTLGVNFFILFFFWNKRPDLITKHTRQTKICDLAPCEEMLKKKNLLINNISKVMKILFREPASYYFDTK